MALGGGTFTAENKVLPGSYINVMSKSMFNVDGVRGTVTIPLALSWGPDDTVFEMDAEDFDSEAIRVFGYESDADELKYVREVFVHATKVYFYKINNTGEKASCTYATAKYKGVRGNDIKIIISINVDDTTQYDVKTYLGTELVDTQTVSATSELVENDYVTFNTEATLEETAGTSLTGGSGSYDDTSTGDQHKTYLDAIESYQFNIIGCMTTDDDVKAVYAKFTKRMREDVGMKFQCVLYDYAADYEGVINVKNSVELVPWVAGLEAACEVNASCTNKLYDGELDVPVSYTQTQLKAAINAGEFVFHKCDTEIRVLKDINSLITTTDSKNELFKDNQIIRVVDYIATQAAKIFNSRYLGSVQNNANGRAAYWGDLVSLHKELSDIGAIEDFAESDISIAQGSSKGSVIVNDSVTVTGTMEQLYMTVYIQ